MRAGLIPAFLLEHTNIRAVRQLFVSDLSTIKQLLKYGYFLVH